MAQRLLIFLVLCVACGGPAVRYEDEVLTVVEQAPGRDFDAFRFQEYRSEAGNVVLNGGAAGILDFLARTQVQNWDRKEPAKVALRRHLVVVLRPGVLPTDPRVLSAFLRYLDADLVRRPLGSDSLTNAVQLRPRSGG